MLSFKIGKDERHEKGEELYQNNTNNDDDEDDEEEANPTKLITYVVDVCGHQISLHIWNNVRYFFFKEIREKILANWTHEKVINHMESINMAPITIQSLGLGKSFRYLLTINDINTLLPQLTEVTSIEHAEIIANLKNNPAIVKPYESKQPRTRQLRRPPPPSQYVQQEDLIQFLVEIRKIVDKSVEATDKAIDTLGPTAIYIHMQTDEFKKQVDIKVKEESAKFIELEKFRLERQAMINFTKEKMEELDKREANLKRDRDNNDDDGDSLAHKK